MSKNLGFWGCRYENPLIMDIAEHYSDSLRNMNEIDQYWLLARLGSHYWLKWGDASPTEAAEEVRDRLEELSKYQLACLVQAIGNKGVKNLGYYSCDYENALIRDIAEHYSDSLRNMSEIDQVWLICMMGEFYFLHHTPEDAEYSTAAEEVQKRLYQLDRMNCGALIQAIANR